jgi:hypothetical protein
MSELRVVHAPPSPLTIFTESRGTRFGMFTLLYNMTPCFNARGNAHNAHNTRATPSSLPIRRQRSSQDRHWHHICRKHGIQLL